MREKRILASISRALYVEDDNVTARGTFVHVCLCTYEQPFGNRTRVTRAFLRARFTLQIRRETSRARARHVADVVGAKVILAIKLRTPGTGCYCPEALF